MSLPEAKSAVVIGAGITGLTAAHRLAKTGWRVRVLEASGRVGGVIGTERQNGWLVERGPNTILSGEPAVTQLIDELKLGEQRIDAAAEARNRYIVRDGRPVAAPLGPKQFLTSPLFSTYGKLRAACDLFARRRIRSADVSLATLVRSHFGTEFVSYALDPFVSGVYAGEPAKLSAKYSFPNLWEAERTVGSLLRGQIAAAKARKAGGEPAPRIFSFRDGLQTLPDALARALPDDTLRLNVSIDALIPGSTWSVVWHDSSGATHTESCDAVVVAVPAPALAQLRVGALGERPLALLETMEHPPVSSLFLGFARADIAHPLDGFGLLVPSSERRQILGVLFSSTLFPGRAPADHVALTVIVGGVRQPGLARLDTGELLATVMPDLEDLLGVTGDPVFCRHTFWPRAIPQYQLGHDAFLSAMAACERDHPGLFIGGQARDGIAVPACIAAGEELARRVTR